ncbi:insulinase family protein [Ichthyenterobacterium sp. W332]|uniref:Insulinase family protein n=1 Tax=Microcosmobacter mediterraneus TaxID=3075607 RepID=A0ABU2YNA8_9FLAO|nr:insulinase family protein [Ichthyenterobacterium sp. W332]MDT0559656.1 insulinase family protein [Ichthyenterobacterium sp. W332]
MKTKFNIQLKAFTFFLLVFTSLGMNAQIDRSQPPKAGPEPEINLEVPREFSLSNGMQVLVVENHKLPRVSYSLRIDNKPIATGDKAGVESLLGSMLGNGTTTISKDEFNEEIDFLGANLNFGFSGGFASSLSKYSDRILELMADAALNPLLTEEEFQKEKDKLIETLKQNEKSTDAISSRVRGVLAYGKNHAYGEYTTEETINNVTFGDVASFYEKYFNPNNAYLVVIGDIDFDTVKTQIENHFGKWKKSVDVSLSVQSAAPNAQYKQINFVDYPNATQSSIFITNNVDLKMNDEEYHAALITNNILGGGGEGYLFKNLREDKGYTYGAYSSLGANRYGLGRFNASAKVRNEVTDSAVVEALKEIKRIKTEPVDPQLLKDAKAKYVGNFIMGLERPQTVANYALNIKLNNLPKDFYATYLQKINDVSIEDVTRVANKYYDDNSRIVIVGKGSEVLENLEKTGIPIKYYDKFANETEKPNYDVEMPEGLDANAVLNKYIDAIGGKDKISKISSVILKYEAEAMGAKVLIEEKRTSDKFAQVTSMNGSPMMSVVAKDKEMYMKQGGQKIPMPQAMLDDIKPSLGVIPELGFMASGKAKLIGIEKVNDKDAYKIEVPGSTMAVTSFYDVETGLKVKEVSVINVMGQTQTQESEFSDYKVVEGIKFPHVKLGALGPQKAEFKLIEVVQNTATDADFD